MNDISAILKKIDEDAKEAAAAILRAGEENRDKILADYRAQAEKERKAILDRANAQCEAIALRAASQAGIAERNKKLQTRREAMDAAFAGAMKKLCSLSDEQKVALFTRMAAANITGDAELILNPADRASIGGALVTAIEKKLAAQSGRSPLAGAAVAVVEKTLGVRGGNPHVSLSKETGSFAGGFLLREGNVETNCTFEVLVSGAKEELEPEVSRVLFENA